jgi:hypothetical protein
MTDVLEGKCEDINSDNGDFPDYQIGGVYIVNILNRFEGKRVRITIEEV